jgi:Arginase family/zinc-ribbon domain
MRSTRVCSVCGTDVPDGARFCPACAAPIGDAPPTRKRKLATTQHIGQVDAQNVPRYVGFRTFARLPRLEDVRTADAAILGAPRDLGSTFRSGSRYGPAAIREASLLLKPYSEPHDVFPFDDMQVVDAGDAPASPIDIAAAHATIERHARDLHERSSHAIAVITKPRRVSRGAASMSSRIS